VLAEGSYRELQKSSSYFKQNLRFSSETSIFNNVIEKNNTDIVEKYSIHEGSQNSILNPVTSFVKEIKIINKDNTDPVKTEESHSIENNSLSVFFKYIFSSEYCFRILCLFSLCILTQVLLSGTDYWINYW
jgi:hypothetical protein